MVALRNLRLRRLVVCLLLSDRSVDRYTRHCKPWLYMKKAHKSRNPVPIPVQLYISTFQTCYAPGPNTDPNIRESPLSSPPPHPPTQGTPNCWKPRCAPLAASILRPALSLIYPYITPIYPHMTPVSPLKVPYFGLLISGLKLPFGLVICCPMFALLVASWV